jgi:hypothetical protein
MIGLTSEEHSSGISRASTSALGALRTLRGASKRVERETPGLHLEVLTEKEQTLGEQPTLMW